MSVYITCYTFDTYTPTSTNLKYMKASKLLIIFLFAFQFSFSQDTNHVSLDCIVTNDLVYKNDATNFSRTIPKLTKAKIQYVFQREGVVYFF